MKSIVFCSLFCIFTFTSFTVKEMPVTVKDYLSIPGPIQYNKIPYKLTWSSHPTSTYYKQEYLPENEKAENFQHMLLVEAVVANLSIKDAVAAKKKELDLRKKTDAVTNYELIENPKTGEYILDFVISESNIVEWNAYRYMQLKDKPGVMLFAYSKRAYGNQTTNFLKTLRTERKKDIFMLADFDIPLIKLAE